MDEDLKVTAEIWQFDNYGWVDRPRDDQTAAILLSRPSAAADRERELVEALRPFAVWAQKMPDVAWEIPSDISKIVQIAIANGHLTGAHFRNAARAVQAKEAGE